MLTHFQYKPLFINEKLPGWQFTFYFKKQKFSGYYHQTGEIEWSGSVIPDVQDNELLKKQLHELMLFHVYE